MARRVGIHAAATPTRPNATIVAVCDSGSHGSMPKSRPRIDRAVVSAPAKPRLIPKGALPTKRSLRKTGVKDVAVFSDGPFHGRCQAANGL